jgi:hypothetical protein
MASSGLTIAEDGKIRKVFYPVFPPDRNADDILAWLRSDAQPGAALNLTVERRRK